MLRVETSLTMRNFSFTRGNYEKVKDSKYDECVLRNGLNK